MMPSDEVLARQAADLKDAAAFSELVRRHQQKILLLQRRLTGEQSLAEDLAQETFIRAWQKLGTFSASGSFAGWLASLSYNVFRAHWRRQRGARSEVPLEEAAAPLVTGDESHADLERLLALLPREDQVILVLGYAYGLSNSEVGEVLGMPSGTVKARVHRAKARIREQIEPEQQTTCKPQVQLVHPAAQPSSPPSLRRKLSRALIGSLKGT